MDTIIKLLRAAAFYIDQVIYGMIPHIYNLIMVLAKAPIFKENAIENFANNIYSLLGLFMLFRLAFSLLNYLINPDLLLDKQKGFGNVIVRAMVSLSLIVAVPFIFNLAFQIQSDVIEKGILTKIFIGNYTSTDNAGNDLASETLKAFISCRDPAQTETTNIEDVKSECELDLEQKLADPTNLASLSEGINDKSSAGYKYDYTPFLSTLCGGFVLWMLILFSFDIALRTVKLAFLQLISPIAIVSYVDPKSSESGMFKKWLDICKSTYLILFVRLLAIAFMSYIIIQLKNPGLQFGNTEVSSTMEFFLNVFIIIGILMFVKQAPEMLGKLFGIEDIGLKTLNPFKKLGEVPGVSLATGLGLGAAAAATGGIVGGIAGGMMGGKGAILGGIGRGFGKGVSNVRGAKGNILGQLKGAISSPGGAIGATGKGLYGDKFAWGPKAKVNEFLQKRQYESMLSKSEQEYGDVYKKIKKATPYKPPEDYGKFKEFMNNFGIDYNDPESSENALKKISKINMEAENYKNNKNFKDAFIASEYAKLKSKNLARKLDFAKVDLEKGAISKDEFNTIANDAGKAEGLYNDAKKIFDEVKSKDPNLTKKYEGYKNYENRMDAIEMRKVTNSPGENDNKNNT